MAETASARLTALYVPLYLFDFRNVVVAVWRPPERNFERIYKDPRVVRQRFSLRFIAARRNGKTKEGKQKKKRKEKERLVAHLSVEASWISRWISRLPTMNYV